MKKVILYSILFCACGAIAPQAAAQKFAIKGYDNIGVNKPLSVTNAQPGQQSKSGFNQFGIDFGYTFWRRGTQSLEANVGVGYSIMSTTFSLPEMSYQYNAPATADEDGNEYIRFYELSNLRQKTAYEFLNVPVYLEYQYKPLKWLGIYAEVGVGLGFRTRISADSVSGMAKAWGVFPEYDDLLIDEPYLDDFGLRSVGSAKASAQRTKPFQCSVMAGAGLEFYTYEPVSFVVGVRYNAGLSQIFNGGYDIANAGEYTAETAPVTYTVADGTTVRSLSEYTTKSRLSPLSIHVGINIRF